MKTTLYRCFDDNGDLLYVGISWNAAARLAAHQRGSGWWAEVVRIDLEHFPTRAHAARAETEAIRQEWPAYNRAQAVTEIVEPVAPLGEGHWRVVDAYFDGVAWQVEMVSPDGIRVASQDPNSRTLSGAVERLIDDYPSLLASEGRDG